MVSGADDAGDQRHGDDDVEPLLDHLAVHAGDLDQHEGQDRAQDQFPHALHPQMHHPPPEELVQHQVVGL
jgi:hypothetical protein